MSLTIQLPVRTDQTEFNLARWEEVLADSAFARLEGRFETNRYGHLVHMPPPAFRHARLQRRIASLLDQLMESGETATECPVSTADGVKGIDVVWLTDDQLAKSEDHSCVPFAPAICVEVRSPGNSTAELEEKKALSFESGASEVWICQENAAMHFFLREEPEAVARQSRLCPGIPDQIDL
ncbi:MAG: Uma2 family endonuclease [Verrucomicrobiota bacterium]